MRILLLHHAPLDSDQAGSQAAALARSLQAAGHELRILTIAEQDSSKLDLPLVCVTAGDSHSHDLPFPRPCYTPDEGGRDYCDLTNAELDTYRQVVRRRIDREVEQFDPHIIHCQHIWVLGHLALETGVPYVLTAHTAELDALARDSRYLRFAHQAAENAGRILVESEDLAARVRQTFHPSIDRVVVVQPSCTAETVEAYQAVLRERGIRH